MKIPEDTTNLSQLPRANKGVALIMVLFLVTILGVLVIAILTISSNDLKSARVYGDGIQVRQLNDAAVNLAVGQLRLGTRQIDHVAGREVWASQPGAIRIYQENGTFVRGVKLYSDSQMTTANETDLVADAPPMDWNSDENQHRYVDLNSPVVRKEQIYFPIVDPTAYQSGIQGFDFDEAAVSEANKTGDRLDLRLPMPVEWLYITKRGDIGTLDSAGVFQGSVTPTKENPIVGRVAFWADDESAKLNVNTASEPTFWDTPRAINKKDMDYGKFQPGRNEYQRYPGHPASTGLSPVLFPENTNLLTTQQKEAIYQLIPRIGNGGTLGGTRRPGETIQTDKDRLFATIDEFIFQPDRETIELIDPDTLRMSRFFLTANSRAPELNPLGKPKIAMWPVGNRRTYPLTAFDNLIAFCSTTGDHLYMFQRANASSPTADWINIPRNQQLFSWLVRDLAKNVPGAGNNFASKFESDLPQIVTQMLDYIRATNLRDTTPTISADGSNGRNRIFAGNGQVAPLKPNSTLMGFGRFFTFSEFGLHFITSGAGSEGIQPADKNLDPDEKLIEVGFLMEPFSPSMGWPPLTNDFSVKITGLDGLQIEQIEIPEMGPAQVLTKTMGFPAEQSYRPGRLSASWHGRAWGGSSGIRTMVARNYPYLSKRLRVKGDSISFKGGDVVVEIYQGGNTSDASRKIQTINLTIPDAEFPMPDLVNRGTSRFRGANATNKNFWWNIRTRYAHAPRAPHAPGEEYDNPLRRWPKDRGGNPPGFKQGGVFRAEDVVRSFVPWHGDYRLVAARSEVPSSVFRPLPNYRDQTINIDHLFADTQGTQLLYGFANEPGVTSGTAPLTQLTNAQYHYARMPDVPPGTGSLNLYGDFDNGVAQIGDGAYINRPDEGNVASKGQYAYFAWNYRSPREVNFSPNRMVPSPGMFGSLPIGVLRERPWQTLLFRPQANHPGNQAPHDHLIMEYFWMPVVEPYAISVPFATSGKVNMNYQILPFTYIERSTGLHGVLKSDEPLAIPNEASKIYKLWDHETSDHPWLPNQSRGNLDPATVKAWGQAARGEIAMRKPVNLEETLKQFEEKFITNKTLFKYPSEICELHLVREDETLSQYKDETFWKNHLVTGDNVKERPYANIYPRLTTKSNIYRVHTRTEVIRKSRDSPPDRFSEEDDLIVARHRGSTLIERYIDPTDKDQPDFALPESDDEDLLNSYKFRLLESKRFSP